MQTKKEIENLAECHFGTEIGSIRGSKEYDLEGDRKNGFIAGYIRSQDHTSLILNNIIDILDRGGVTEHSKVVDVKDYIKWLLIRKDIK